MNHTLRWLWLVCISCGLPGTMTSRAISAEPAAAAHAHQQFEREVRPILIKHCIACHGPKKSHNGLRLDSRSALLTGGDSGPAVVPGHPEKSLLIEAVEHRSFEMPPEPAARLKPEEIAALETWIRHGVAWPADPSAPPPDTLDERAKTFWGFRPVENPAVPSVRNSAWSSHPVDRFLAARREAAGLEPAADADSRTLIRRVTFVLTGLPPSPADVEAFAGDSAGSAAAAERAYTALVDRLLASPRFGQHWARHWMDWVRYCESHGSEGDPPIPFAWRYRDYLIRALNADVPYDQLIREHLAGDLLPRPRVNPALGINESILGTANLRFVEHGYHPIDPREDLVKFTDNQIDVVTKAFQALTVSCARCHDHKFDAIAQRDFYGLFPIFVASRPAQVQIDLPDRLHHHDVRLEQLKVELRAAVARDWLRSLDDFPGRLKVEFDSRRSQELAIVAKPLEHPLHPWHVLRNASRSSFPQAWRKLSSQYDAEVIRRKAEQQKAIDRRIVIDDAEWKRWRGTGAGAPREVSAPGEFTVAVDGSNVIDAILPRGAYTHRLSSKQGAVITSPPFRIEHDAISVRILGAGRGTARLVVENYPVGRGGIYDLSSAPGTPGQHWFTWRTAYWRGFDARIELATFDDLTISNLKGNQEGPTDGRSSIGISEIWFHRSKTPPAAALDIRMAGAWVVRDAEPKSADELAQHYARLARAAVEAWRDQRLSDEQAELLGSLVKTGVLPNTAAALPAAKSLWSEYRKLEAEIPVARRSPGVIETESWDEPLMIRGNHQSPGKTVTRHYLDALGSHSLVTGGSGRLALAEQIATADNPLTARVAANRLWHYVFGRGIVATVDNFGKLGSPPTHPQLLDHLATRLVADGWSLKKSIRYLVLSRSFRLASTPTAAARKHDPENIWLTHARLRRLEAEAIRDSLLAVAGRLEAESDEGPGFNDYDPPQEQTRRSVYVTIRRTAPAKLLEVFDAPKPFTTLGARDVTNVPGQALTLLNDRLVIEAARHWARAELKLPVESNAQRIDRMYRQAFSRPPEAEELAAAERMIADLAKTYDVRPQDAVRSEQLWRDFAHALYNLKEFIYVR